MRCGSFEKIEDQDDAGVATIIGGKLRAFNARQNQMRRLSRQPRTFADTATGVASAFYAGITPAAA
jgi:hypothetical protein